MRAGIGRRVGDWLLALWRTFESTQGQYRSVLHHTFRPVLKPSHPPLRHILETFLGDEEPGMWSFLFTSIWYRDWQCVECAPPPQFIFIGLWVNGTFTTSRLCHNRCKFWYTFNSILERKFFSARLLTCTHFKIDPSSPQAKRNFLLRFGTSFLRWMWSSFVDGPNPPSASNGRTISCEYILWLVCKEKLQICPCQLHHGCPSVRLSTNKLEDHRTGFYKMDRLTDQQK